jgi:tRNA(Ile)-lysidine synthase
MSPRRGVFRRPLLQVRRSVTEAACAELSLRPWQDPHNTDRSMARARIRHQALPALTEALGDGVAAALARTADRLREDDEALTLWAQRLHDEASTVEGGLEIARLAAAPAGARVRALRLAALAAGVPGGSLRTLHLKSLDDLVVRWRGQGPVSLPGRVRGSRRCGRLYLARVDEA